MNPQIGILLRLPSSFFIFTGICFEFFYLFIYSYVHTLFGPFLPLAPRALPLSPPTPLLPGKTCSALFSNFLGEDISNNKKDIAFFLVEIRIAIQRDS
jgi:hypothetical protein